MAGGFESTNAPLAIGCDSMSSENETIRLMAAIDAAIPK